MTTPTKPKRRKSRAGLKTEDRRRLRKPTRDLWQDLDCPCGERFAVTGPKLFIDAATRAWQKRHAGH